MHLYMSRPTTVKDLPEEINQIKLQVQEIK